jgi:dihydroflavonol-4-reductase
MRIVVTGSNGHIGRNFVGRLVSEGHDVCGFDLNSPVDLPAGVEFVQGDVRDGEALVRCFAGADQVFHLAALISIDGDRGGLVQEVNVKGAATAAEAARQTAVGRYVHFSSVHAFDATSTLVVDEDSPRALGPRFAAYDRSKAEGEAEVRKVIEAGLNGVIVHPSGVIGAADHEPSRAGGGLLDAARGRLPVMVQGGFDFVDIRDVIAGALAAAERGERGRNYILSGSKTTIADMSSAAAKRAGAPAPLVILPRWLLRPLATLPTLVGRIRGREPIFTTESIDTLGTVARFSHDRAARELGYRPRPIEETIEGLVGWFIEAGMLRVSKSLETGVDAVEFVSHLHQYPIDTESHRNLLGRVLAEVAVADGSIARPEQELLTQFCDSGPDEFSNVSPVAAEEIEDVPTGVRESMLLIALALAWVDEEFTQLERQTIEGIQRRLELLPARAFELEVIAKEYLLDQLFDAIYVDGVMDPEEEKRASGMAARFEVTPARLHELDRRARNRRSAR